jgi:hypothetical protein
MAKKKTYRPEVSKMLFSLNYVYNSVECYGNDNNYSHDLMLSHLKDVVELIEKDKENNPTLK